MRNKFKYLKFKRRLSISAYYRLSLQDILQDVNKIIYLDGDTLVLGDLKELIYSFFVDKYINNKI